MLAILSFIYGASIGSFVQVVASRLHVAPILKGRSKCLSCGETLHASDLIPVFSYVFLGGKCRYCKSTYGVSALVIELLYGFSFFLVYKLIVADLGLSLEALLWLVYYTLLFIVLGVMALYDKAHSYIPSKFLMAFLALCGVIFVRRIMEDQDITTWLSPFFVALPFLSIWLISKGKGLGLGDVILFFGVGAFFGSLQGFAVLMISVWLGALYGLYIKFIVHKNKNKFTPIPFVPFIAIAFLIVLFTGVDIFFF